EGLSPSSNHALQTAWVAEQVPQCGYCQSGQLMSAAALLARKPKPTDADIDAAMNGNICRCATYLRIRQAIHFAATLPANAASSTGRGKRQVFNTQRTRISRRTSRRNADCSAHKEP